MSSLKKKSISGVIWSLLGTFSSQGIGFVISIILARLLTPEDFGIVGLSLVFISITQVFADFGFASALIQSKENTSKTYSSIFFLNLAFGLILFVLFQLFAPFLGDFYENPMTGDIIKWLSFNFILSGLSLVQQTILRREVDFKKLSIRQIISQLIGGLLGVVAAFYGLGVYSLVIQYLGTSVINTIVLWKISNWYPKFEFSINEIKRLAGFGSFFFLDRLLATISQRLDVLFVGKVFSPETLGYYSRADSTNNLVTTYSSKSITQVFFPVLSKVQDDPGKFEDIYYKVVSVICILSFFLSGVLFILGDEIIIGLFGVKWKPSVLIFQILVFKSFSFPLNSMMVNALLAKGKVKANFKLGLVRRLGRLIPLIFGLLYGLNELLWAIVIISYVLTLINIYFISSFLGLNLKEHFVAVFEAIPPLLLCLLLFPFIDNINLVSKVFMVLGYFIVFLGYVKIMRIKGFEFLLNQIIHRDVNK
ncbi:lipopolysaccharide biosynthesis protein [Fulvivirga sedimenti]|uniref:Lipopolysaccharide biosynthesis protein n=1 Tax=Fulvivirga sedimenti TaxID=2879465 RepID=A0A9X1HJQ7_9BACT|nr:lipopolysaccharide biosynthesis protein [Fulvivirga sedimenti]MCA6073434.1 lipopolysaccharide biosynthesis protein [Fulvivirga sedimenti]